MDVKGLQQVRKLQTGGGRARGLRQVPTLAGQAERLPPRSRAQAATEFARLENERARIVDELVMRAAMQQE